MLGTSRLFFILILMAWTCVAWCQGPRGAWVFVPSPHHSLLLCCLLQRPQVWHGPRIELLVALGERHGADVRVLR